MFNIFQYEKINKTRLNNKKAEEQSEKEKLIHDKKNISLSSSANIRRLEWAAKFLESDMRNILQEGSIKLLNSSILECRKDSSSEASDSEIHSTQIKKIINKMDTKILHPYSENKLKNSPDSLNTEISKVVKKLENSRADTKKPFNPYCRHLKKNESAWLCFQTKYISSPYEPTTQQLISQRSVPPRESFKLGIKSDLWNSLIKPRESIRSYQSNKNLHSLPDSKLYKKSLEHLISRKN